MPDRVPDNPPTNPETKADLYDRTYERLRHQAHHLMQSEKEGHTLQPTALVHEAFLRLAEVENSIWKSRAHFLAVASRAMRRILIDHARGRSRVKRGKGWQRVTLHDAMGPEPQSGGLDHFQVIQFDQALLDLEKKHPRMARVAEMRLFGGMTMDEIADTLGVSKRTVEGDWNFGRRWLATSVQEGHGNSRLHGNPGP